MTEPSCRSWPVKFGSLSLSLGLSAIGLLATACGDGPPEMLGGAEQLATGGEATWSDFTEVRLSDDPDKAVNIGELPLEDAATVVADADGESFSVLLEEYGPSDSRVAASVNGGAVIAWSSAPVSASATQTAVHMTAAGRYVTARDGDVGRALTRDPWDPSEIGPNDPRILVYDPISVPKAEYPLPFSVGALDLADDGTVLAGGMDEGRIARIDTDGTTTHPLGPAGSGAQVTADTDLGPVIAVMLLDDDRAVFVAGTDGDTRLYLLDDTAVRQIPADSDEQTSPVSGTDERRVPDFEEPYPRAAITPLAPSPDGRVLTTGIGPDGDPQISLVDVDTGDIEVLATLDDVEPTIDDPVSAAIVGDDLIFLAQHQLWRLPDVAVFEAGVVADEGLAFGDGEVEGRRGGVGAEAAAGLTGRRPGHIPDEGGAGRVGGVGRFGHPGTHR